MMKTGTIQILNDHVAMSTTKRRIHFCDVSIFRWPKECDAAYSTNLKLIIDFGKLLVVKLV